LKHKRPSIHNPKNERVLVNAIILRLAAHRRKETGCPERKWKEEGRGRREVVVVREKETNRIKKHTIR
jgi:hypothetical protein